MLKEKISDSLLSQIEPVITGLGYTLVDLNSKLLQYGMTIHCVVYKPSGVGIEDCSIIHKTIMPKLEIITDSRDIHLEVSSPGTDRNLKSNSEFLIFRGKGIRILTKDSSEWIMGIIDSADKNGVTVLKNGELHNISYTNVKKAKLDYSEEVNRNGF